jgi:hypothetical protein
VKYRGVVFVGREVVLGDDLTQLEQHVVDFCGSAHSFVVSDGFYIGLESL